MSNIMPIIHAIIPARGGSKGLPGKNLRAVGGKPLIVHAIDAALGSPLISRCHVTTDDPAIAAVAQRWGASVIERPDELAGDEVLVSEAVLHLLDTLAARGEFPDYFVLLQPTSPLRQAHHVQECLERFLEGKFASAVSVCEVEHHPYKMFIQENGALVPFRHVEDLERPRQSLQPVYRQNGAIYVMGVETFRRERAFYAAPALSYIMDVRESVDIDTELDLGIVEMLSGGEKSVATSSPWMAFPKAVRKCGKPIDMKRLNRTLDWRVKTAADQQCVAERYKAARGKPLTQCPICEHSKSQPFVTVYDSSFLECGSCGNIYMETPPDQESIAKLYVGQEEEKCIQGNMYIDEAIFLRRVADIARPKVDFVKGLVLPGGVWIDVGCGTGELLTAASENGWRVVGVEADPESATFARKRGLDVHEGFLPSPELNHLFADAAVVSMINVLEHVVDPVGLLRGITAELAAGAAVVFEVPRHPSLSSYSNFLFPELAYRHIYPPDHLNIFTEKAVAVMLERSGLESVGVWNFGQDFQDLLSASTLHAGRSESPLLDAILDVTPEMQQVLDNGGLSDTLFIVAIKP